MQRPRHAVRFADMNRMISRNRRYTAQAALTAESELRSAASLPDGCVWV